jgi:hypothetical protein
MAKRMTMGSGGVQSGLVLVVSRLKDKKRGYLVER